MSSSASQAAVSAQMFFADSAVAASVVVRTVVTVSLVTENFPLDTPITEGARAVPVAAGSVFFLSRRLNQTLARPQVPRVQLSGSVFRPWPGQ